MVERYGQVSHSSMCTVNMEVAQGYFDISGADVGKDDALSLCSSHYQHMYKEVNHVLHAYLSLGEQMVTNVDVQTQRLQYS